MAKQKEQKKRRNKTDAYKSLSRFLVMFAVLLVICVGAFVLSDKLISSDYQQTCARIEEENARGEAEFNQHMEELREQAEKASQPSFGAVISTGELKTWDTVIDGSIWRVEDQGGAGLENTSTIAIERSDLLTGGLLLVNAWHSLPSDFSDAALVSVRNGGAVKLDVEDSTVVLFKPALDALVEALTAAKEEAGLEHYIVREGYRSVAKQESMFTEKMQALSSRYTGNRLIEETKKQVNYPGTSDYHTGLSFRMDVYERGNTELNKMKFQAESEQGKWLTENCWRFGIIFRFPAKDFPNSSWEDKSYITGVSSNINLYRYVGKAHSTAMKVLNMCLEEYIEFLIDHPHICIYQDGTLMYEVVRVNAPNVLDTYSLPLSNPATSYQASLDNMDGIVMAYSYQ